MPSAHIASEYLFATDVDGTLLTQDYQLLPEVKAAVNHASANGIRIMLATARGPAGLDIVLDALGEVDFAICFGGALMLERTEGAWSAMPGQTVLNKDDVVAVQLAAAALGVAVGGYGQTGVYVSAADPWFERELAHTGEPVTIAPFTTIDEPIFKILAIVEPAHAANLEHVRLALPQALEGVYSHPNYLEIMVRGVSKGEALSQFCRSRGIDVTTVVVAGDGDNDVSMFRIAGHSAAMPLASAAAKAAAQWTVPAGATPGVAAVIQHYATSLWRIPAPRTPESE